MRAFSSTFVRSNNSFLAFEAFLLQQFLFGMKKDDVFPYLVLLQSSGWGKTRFIFEFCKDRGILLLYLNLRCDGSGYPPSSSEAAGILSSMAGPHDNAIGFASTLVMRALELAQSEQWTQLLHQATTEQSLEIFNSFWKQCLSNSRANATATLASIPTSSSTINSSSSAQLASDPISASALARARAQEDVGVLESATSAGSASSHESVRILFVVDEARALLRDEKVPITDSTPEIPSRLRAFRKALHNLRSSLKSQGVVVLLLDTFSKVSNFCPPAQKESSSARSQGHSVLAPFVSLGFDPYLFTELPANSGPLGFESILLYGRPLWRASALSGMSFEDLISFAERKLLLQTGAENRITEDATPSRYHKCCAVVCCLLDLEAQSELSSNLVASHMVQNVSNMFLFFTSCISHCNYLSLIFCFSFDDILRVVFLILCFDLCASFGTTTTGHLHPCFQ